MLEIITQINDLIKRVGKLESLETPFKSYGPWANRPTAPFDGQRFFATDSTRRIEYEWDNSASNWLSTQIFDVSLGTTRSNTANAQAIIAFAGVFNRKHTLGGLLLTGLVCGFVPANTAQSGTNFYTLTGSLQANNNSPALAAITLSGTVDTKLLTTINNPYELSYDLNQVVAAGYHRPSVTMTPTLNPGTFFLEATLSYRVIG